MTNCKIIKITYTHNENIIGVIPCFAPPPLYFLRNRGLVFFIVSGAYSRLGWANFKLDLPHWIRIELNRIRVLRRAKYRKNTHLLI